MLVDHPNIILCKPLEYGFFVAAMKRAYLIISNSGVVQEEAPELGKPVLVLRNEMERPETVDTGVVNLVGTDAERIVRDVHLLLDDLAAYHIMAQGASPYGDGRAGEHIVNVLKKHFD